MPPSKFGRSTHWADTYVSTRRCFALVKAPFFGAFFCSSSSKKNGHHNMGAHQINANGRVSQWPKMTLGKKSTVLTDTDTVAPNLRGSPTPQRTWRLLKRGGCRGRRESRFSTRSEYITNEIVIARKFFGGPNGQRKKHLCVASENSVRAHRGQRWCLSVTDPPLRIPVNPAIHSRPIVAATRV